MADVFDEMLISRATVLKLDDSFTDDSGHASGNRLVAVATGVPCRVSVNVGGGRERRTPVQPSSCRFRIFVRPLDITPANWLLVDGAYYNVQDVQNPSNMNHHYELICEQIVPDGMYEGS